MSFEEEYHIIKETFNTGDSFQQSISSEQYTNSDGSFQHHLFIKSTRPRYLEISEDPLKFHQFLKEQLSDDFDNYGEPGFIGSRENKYYQPILGYENLSDIYEHSRRFGSDPNEILKKLDSLYIAIKDWNLEQIESIIDDDRFYRYLEILKDEEFGSTVTLDNDFRDRVIKKMIIEQIGSIVRPIKNDRDIKEKEVNLIILLNTK